MQWSKNRPDQASGLGEIEPLKWTPKSEVKFVGQVRKCLVAPDAIKECGVCERQVVLMDQDQHMDQQSSTSVKRKVSDVERGGVQTTNIAKKAMTMSQIETSELVQVLRSSLANMEEQLKVLTAELSLARKEATEKDKMYRDQVQEMRVLYESKIRTTQESFGSHWQTVEESKRQKKQKKNPVAVQPGNSVQQSGVAVITPPSIPVSGGQYSALPVQPMAEENVDDVMDEEQVTPIAEKRGPIIKIPARHHTTSEINSRLRINYRPTDYTLTVGNFGFIVLKPKTLRLFTAIKAELQEKKIRFQTFTPESARETKFILKGLDLGYSEEDVMELLKNEEALTVEPISAKRLWTGKLKRQERQFQRKIVEHKRTMQELVREVDEANRLAKEELASGSAMEEEEAVVVEGEGGEEAVIAGPHNYFFRPQKLPHFRVAFPAGTKMASIKVKYLNGIEVRWEALKKTFELPMQCHNCQQRGHATSNCELDPVCCKCAGGHRTRDCLTIGRNDPQAMLRCCLCNKTGHPASWLGCEVAVKLRREREQRQRERNEKKMQRQQNRNGGQQQWQWGQHQRPVVNYGDIEQGRLNFAAAAPSWEQRNESTAGPSRDQQRTEPVHAAAPAGEVKETLQEILRQLRELNNKTEDSSRLLTSTINTMGDKIKLSALDIHRIYQDAKVQSPLSKC